MHRKNFLIAAALILTSIVWAPELYAQALVLTDCQGFVRAMKQVEPGELSKIDINVGNAAGNPADGIEVTLTNTTTGQSTTTVAHNGVATFENIGTGSFSVTSTAPGATVSSVSVGPMVAGVAIATVAVAGAGAAAAGGAVAVGVAVSNNSGGSGGGGSNPNPTTAPTARPTAAPTAPPRPEPTSPPSGGCTDCDPNARPTPIPTFFPEQATAVDERAAPLSPYS